MSSNVGSRKDSSKKSNTEIEKILERQLKAGGYSTYYDTDYAFYEYDKTDLDISLPPIINLLFHYGYKRIDEEVFIKKIQTIFGVANRYDDIFYINSFDKCFKPQKINYYDLDGFRKDLYFSIENKIILNLYSLPEIIDYQKEYPEIASKEFNFPNEVTRNGNTEKIYLTKWKDITDLAEQRTKNISILVNRNKYLFNDSKASLVWLKTHDKFFLESLVKTFGYVQDKDLLKWVLEKNLLKNSQDDIEEFAKILWTRNCDGKIEVHKEVFDFMLTQNEIEREKYASSLLLFRNDYKNTGKDLSFSELTKIRALVCYYGTKMSDNYFYSFFPYLHSEKYAEEFKKNNYYDISDFKELYEDAKYGGINEPY